MAVTLLRAIRAYPVVTSAILLTLFIDGLVVGLVVAVVFGWHP